MPSVQAIKIIKMLKARHQGEEWACFEELRTGTGYGRGRENRIDLLCINLFPSKRMADGTPRIISYEVKISHADFMHEIDNPGKRSVAENMSTDCYFVCPSGVLSSEEIPDPWGLMVAGKFGFKATKVAKQRSIGPWNWDAVSALARRASDPGQKGTSLVWSYAGEELDAVRLREIAVKAFDCSMVSSNKIAVAAFKASEEYVGLNDLLWTVRRLTGSTSAETFSEWFGKDRVPELPEWKKSTLRSAISILNDLVGTSKI